MPTANTPVYMNTDLQHTHARTEVCSDSMLSHAHRYVFPYVCRCTLPMSMGNCPAPWSLHRVTLAQSRPWCTPTHLHSTHTGRTDPGTLAYSTQTRPHCAAPHAAAHTHTLALLSANCWRARGEGDEAHDSARKRGAGGARAGEEMTARGPPRVPAHEY